MSDLDLRERLLMALVRRMPRHAVTRAVGFAAGLKEPAGLSQAAVRAFARRYDLNLEEAEKPLESYDSVRALFTRALKPGLRPIAPGVTVPVSPADGKVSAAGVSADGQLLQVKGSYYRLADLVADSILGNQLSGGAYLTVYLSPHDYHRVHAPLGGTLKTLTYVPGDLWPVNPASVSTVPGLFTVNERMVYDFETPAGRVAVVMVGATVVGRLRATVGGVEPFLMRPRQIERRELGAGLPVEKGEQIGIFDMGSTVVVCFAPGAVFLRPLEPAQSVVVGETLLER